MFPIPIPPPTSFSTRSLWVFPVHQARALVSCIQPGLVICFTIDNIHVSMLFFNWISSNEMDETGAYYTERIFFDPLTHMLWLLERNWSNIWSVKITPKWLNLFFMVLQTTLRWKFPSLFCSWSSIHTITLLGNFLIVTVTSMDPALQTPMSFFLRNLSLLEVCFTLVMVPNMLVDLV